jgi:hypothetical protein
MQGSYAAFWCGLLRLQCKIGVAPAGTFTLEPNESNGLSTAAGPAGTIAVDLKLARAPRQQPGKEGAWCSAGVPGDSFESLPIHHPPTPPSGRLPPGRFLLWRARFYPLCGGYSVFGLAAGLIPLANSRYLAMPAHGAIAGKGPGTRAESRTDGRRDVL